MAKSPQLLWLTVFVALLSSCAPDSQSTTGELLPVAGFATRGSQIAGNLWLEHSVPIPSLSHCPLIETQIVLNPPTRHREQSLNFHAFFNGFDRPDGLQVELKRSGDHLHVRTRSVFQAWSSVTAIEEAFQFSPTLDLTFEFCARGETRIRMWRPLNNVGFQRGFVMKDYRDDNAEWEVDIWHATPSPRGLKLGVEILHGAQLNLFRVGYRPKALGP